VNKIWIHVFQQRPKRLLDFAIADWNNRVEPPAPKLMVCLEQRIQEFRRAGIEIDHEGDAMMPRPRFYSKWFKFYWVLSHGGKCILIWLHRARCIRSNFRYLVSFRWRIVPSNWQ